ncbi:MAG: response regulator transcription factor [Streptosporangiaceae bacterium]
MIVLLAGRGLTNAEIADRMFLAPSTVASHLYHSYPKLGIAGRHQLRDLIWSSGPAPADTGRPPWPGTVGNGIELNGPGLQLVRTAASNR